MIAAPQTAATMLAAARTQARLARAAGDDAMAAKWDQCADMWQRKTVEDEASVRPQPRRRV